jgi:hypothetical protein
MKFIYFLLGEFNMIVNRVSLLLFPMIILLFITPMVSAIGEFTVDIYETEREIIFHGNQGSQTIYMDGIVNYTGVSASGDTIELSSYFDLGESKVSPEEVTFQSTGSEEFTVELIIPNNYENGTIGNLVVTGILQKGSSTIQTSDNAFITLINQSDTNNDNNGFDNSGGHEKDSNFTENNGILMISVITIIVIIIIFIFYKKKQK